MPYLESLSTAELAELAGRNGLDIPPGLERVFIIGELLELERMEARRPGGEWRYPAGELRPGEFEGELSEVSELPDQYGMSYVDVLIRDPLWVFACWEVKKQARDAQDGEADPEHCLRIVPLRGDDLVTDVAASFTVAVGAGDRSLYLGIPHEGGRCFRVELCARQGEDFAVLAASRPFRLPGLVPPPPDSPLEDGDHAVYGNPLAELSGASRFPLVRSVDRPHRHKGQ